MTDVVDFYDQRSILITGASGFLGKVLVEKLLRSVSNVKRIFLLIRPRNGANASQRLEQILLSQLFETLKNHSPQIFEKLTPVNGDIIEENLGLSADDAQAMLNEVSVVFHCAATVKFDEALRVSVDMNVSGTRRLLEFCRNMKKISVFVHASTAYANCDRAHILESVYSPPIDPAKLVDALSWMDDKMVTSLTPMLIGRRPNTYTYTKAIAEHIVSQEAANLPVTIVRPSIIGAIWREPLPVGKGLLRTMMGECEATADIVPVDVVSNVLIVAAWHRANEPSNCCPVVNCCTGSLNTLKWRDIAESMKYFEKYPLEDVFRVPKPRFTTSKYWRETMVFFDHMLPAYLADFCYKIFGHKPKLIRLYQKIFCAVNTLEYFTTRDWHFQSKMIVNLLNDLSSEDKKTFNIDLTQIDWNQYFEMYVVGVKKYILKEKMSNLDAARRKYRRKRFYMSLIDLLAGVFIFKFLLARYRKTFRRLWFYILSAALAFYRMYPAVLIDPCQVNVKKIGSVVVNPKNPSFSLSWFCQLFDPMTTAK